MSKDVHFSLFKGGLKMIKKITAAQLDSILKHRYKRRAQFIGGLPRAVLKVVQKEDRSIKDLLCASDVKKTCLEAEDIPKVSSVFQTQGPFPLYADQVFMRAHEYLGPRK